MKIIYKVVDLLLASFYSFTLNAQTKFPTIINLSGDSKQIEGIIWDWSFGEQLLVNTLYSDKNFLLTTGFLQNDFRVGVDFKIPGIDGIASCLFSPSITKIGITKSSVVSTFSLTKLLIDSLTLSLLFLECIILEYFLNNLLQI